MTSSIFSKLTLLLLAVAAYSPVAAQPAPTGQRPPNIVLIMADDLGVETLGCYGGLSYATPHLDRLAATGLRFTHAYAQPLCTNTRLQLMTGRYNDRNWKAFGILDPQAKTIGHYLSGVGYRTLIAGKWQLQSYDPPDYPGSDGRRGTGMHPDNAGFDQYSLFHSLHTEDKGSRYADPTWLQNGELKHQSGGYGPDVWTEQILDFITSKADRPFFVYYAMALPHWPMTPTPQSDDWQNPELRHIADTRYFGDMVEYLDQCVGRIADGLQTAGVADNTLLLFYSDNGTHLDITSQTVSGPVAGGKGLTTNAGTHVPLIAHWPGRIAAGVSDRLIDSTDFLPTLMTIAGRTAPADLDGISFADVLTGTPEGAPPRQWIYSYFDPRPGWDKDQFTRQISVRDHQYKWYSRGDFYDVSADPLEQHPIPPEQQNDSQRTAQRRLSEILSRTRADQH